MQAVRDTGGLAQKVIASVAKEPDATIGKVAATAGSAGLGMQWLVDGLDIAVGLANLFLAAGGIALLIYRYRRMRKKDRGGGPGTPVLLVCALLGAAALSAPAEAETRTTAQLSGPMACEANPIQWHHNWRADTMNRNPGLVEKALDAEQREAFVWAFNNSKAVTVPYRPAQVYLYALASAPKAVVVFVGPSGCIQFAWNFPVAAVVMWLQGKTLDGRMFPEPPA